MYAPEFGYYRAGSVAEVGELLAQHPEAKLLAGGHSLIPVLKLRLAAPPALIDIGRLPELKGISADDGTLRIGALTTHAELAASTELREHAPALAEAAGKIGDPAVRNRGTIGGNIAHADPASDLPAVLVALGATFNTVGASGERSIAAVDFFQDLFTTALGDDEIITRVDLSARGAGEGQAYTKFAHPASRYAVIGVAASLTVTAGACSAAAVVVGGLVVVPRRVSAVEQALLGQELSDENITQAANQVGGDLGEDLLGDLFASAEYRRAVAHVYVREALTAAAERAS
jgi:carbon-monoxide dehydrogenase medium subunit